MSRIVQQQCEEHEDSGMAIELTLSAILVASVAGARGDTELAKEITAQARERLWPKTDAFGEAVPEDVLRCFRVLKDPEQQPAFFTDYFNWPEWWLEQSAPPTLAALF